MKTGWSGALARVGLEVNCRVENVPKMPIPLLVSFIRSTAVSKDLSLEKFGYEVLCKCIKSYSEEELESVLNAIEDHLDKGKSLYRGKIRELFTHE